VGEPTVDDGDGEFTFLAERLHWSMFRIAATFRRREYARINGGDLTLTQCSILYRLREHAPLRVTDLASLEGVTTATMTMAVGRLEELGMVTRQRDTTDRRLIWIDLTRAGRAAPRAAVTDVMSAMRDTMTAEDLAALSAAIGPLQALARLGDAAQGRSR
jgi:DNA-binding MarR family transcriptional regulator